MRLANDSKRSFPKQKIYNVIFILGLPASGKGTQCQRIQEEFGIKHLSAGELLRDECHKPESEYKEIIEKNMIAGTITPSIITIELLRQAMHQATDTKNFLIDGFPRNRENLALWEAEMGDMTDLKLVLYFDSSVEVCIKRGLARGQGRSDDNEEVMHHRIKTYRVETRPIIRHFLDMGIVKKVDALMRTPDEVFMKRYAKFSRPSYLNKSFNNLACT